MSLSRPRQTTAKWILNYLILQNKSIQSTVRTAAVSSVFFPILLLTYDRAISHEQTIPASLRQSFQFPTLTFDCENVSTSSTSTVELYDESRHQSRANHAIKQHTVATNCTCPLSTLFVFRCLR